MVRFCFLVITLVSFFVVAHASEFKVNQEGLELKFNQAVEVSLYDSKLLDNTSQEFAGREINQNMAGIAAICCGSFGLHRFYMGHTDAGLKHLGTTFLVGILGVAAIYTLIATGPGSSSSSASAGVLSAVGYASYTLAYCISGAHGLYTLVEGIMYLTMPEEKFQSKIVKDPRFFAAFSRN